MNYVKLDLQEYNRLKQAERNYSELEDCFAFSHYNRDSMKLFYTRDDFEKEFEDRLKHMQEENQKLYNDLQECKNQPWYKKLFK